MAWNDGLVGVALNIAGSEESPLRVLAGPGTGKTYAMKRRVMRLLESDEDPRRVLACTFTRTAARDIAKEIAALGVDGADKVWAGTLHSLCFSILTRQEVLQATGRVARPLAKTEVRFLLQDLQGAFGGVKKAAKKLLAFEAAWARLQNEEPGWPQDPADQAFQTALLAWLRFHGAMLIGEIVPVTLAYMQNNPMCPERSKFDHVIVDEFQDLNRAEQVLVDLLAEQAKVSIIGDEDQSIYSFKHAHPEGITDFHDEHPGTHDETLDMCRRCPTLVVKLANSLIKNNDTCSGRPLKARQENGQGIVHIVQWASLNAEAEGVASYVLQRIEQDGVLAGEILILAPRRQMGHAVRDALGERAVVAHSFFSEQALDGNPKKLDECDAQQAYALLTLLADPEDRVAMRCWCGFGNGTLNDGGWMRLRAYCEANGETPRQVLEQLVSVDIKIPYTKNVVERFKLLQEKEEDLNAVSGHALSDGLFPEDQEWTEPLRSIVKQKFPLNKGFTRTELLEEIRAGVTQMDTPTDVDYVRVMSLHKSKGLTARVVIVMGCNEGLIPRIDYDEPLVKQQECLEEQRRLFYVALTRTTETLVLSSIAHIPMQQALQMGLGVQGGGASQFIAQLGPSRPAAISGEELIE
jgi:DNA helicase II / ATP-dependent DNA helicase PcrA